MHYKKWSRITLILLGLITIINGYYATQLEFSYDYERFFPQDDPDLDFFLEYRKRFENDNDFILIGLESNKSIFRKDFLVRVDSFCRKLKTLPGIERVINPVRIKETIITPLAPMEVPLLHYQEPSRYKKDSTRIYQSEQYVGTFFAKDARSVTVLAETKEMLAKDPADTLCTRVYSLLDNMNFHNTHVAGKIVAQSKYINRLKKELVIFIGSAIVLIIIFLVIAFRSVWGVLVPMSVVLLTVVWITGFMGMTGEQVGIMTVLLPSIMFVVAMSDVVHITNRYLEELRNGKNKIKALQITVREIGIATFLTSLTTAIGFFTLVTSGTPPVQDFGLYTGIGVFIAFFLAFTFYPSVLINLPQPRLSKKITQGFFWYHKLISFYLWVIRHQKTIILSTLLITGLSLYGISKININTSLLADLSKDDPLKKDFAFFNKHYGGVRPFEMAVTLEDTSDSFFDYEVMKELNKIQSYLDTTYGVNNIMSPVTVIKTVNKAMHSGDPSAYRFPESKKQYKKITSRIKPFLKRPEFKQILNRPNHMARISGKMEDLSSSAVEEKNNRLSKHLRSTIDSSLINWRLTGTVLLIGQNNRTLATSMIESLSIAFGVIALLMGILFKSLRIVIVTLIPNILPLLIIGGIMGWASVDLNVPTSIIFTIAFGIAVDDTIHFMSRLRLETSRNKNLPLSIKSTFTSAGKAIIITSFILSAGFLTLISSDFIGTFYTGLLVSLTLIFALVADLTLLPVLLLRFFRKKK